jgi:hypothetical protein
MMADTKIMDVFAKYGQLSPIEGSYLYELMMYAGTYKVGPFTGKNFTNPQDGI